MKIARIIAGMLAAVMLMLSAMSEISYGDIITSSESEEKVDSETGFIFTLLDDDTYSVYCPEENRDKLTGHLIIPAEINDKKVTVIEKDAFLNCENITYIQIPETITSIMDGAFSGCNGLTAISVDKDNQYYCDERGTLLNKEKTELIKYPSAKKIEKYAIPESVISISNGAFANCKILSTITIPKMTSHLGIGVFNGCVRFTSVEIPNNITEIPESAFENCTKLESITIPSRVKLIGKNAFSGANVRDVYYKDSESKWNNIELKEGNSELQNATIHYSIIEPVAPNPPVNPDPINPDDSGEDEPTENILPAPQNIRKDNIFGRISWDPVKGAENYFITVKNTITDKNGSKYTYTTYSNTNELGNTENAWIDWTLLAAPYSDEKHEIRIRAYGNSQYSDISDPFFDNFTPSLNESMATPDKVWGEENFLKWTAVDNAATYWFEIYANDKRICKSYSNIEQKYAGNYPNETYEVEMCVVDKNHTTSSKNTYSVQIGKSPVNSIWVPEINYDSETDLITITYEDPEIPALAFWIRIKDENGKLIRMERITDTTYLVGELPQGKYVIDVCAEAYINHKLDLNDFSQWSPSIELVKQINNPDESDTSESEPDTSESETDTSDTSDTSESDTSENESDTSDSDASEPTTSDSGTSSTDTSNTDTSEPDIDNSNTSKPDTGESDTSEPNNSTSEETSTPTMPSSDSFSGEVKIDGNVPKTSIQNSTDELIKLLLSDKEKEQHKNGISVNIILEVKDINKSVFSGDAQAVEAILSGMSDYKLGQYLDITLLKIVESTEKTIVRTLKPITIVFEIPDTLLKPNREYAVICVHNGESSILDDMDSSEKTVTIKTDKFSTYALIYKDKENIDDNPLLPTDSDPQSSGGLIDTPNNSSDNSNEYEDIPYTGIQSYTTVYLTVGLIALFVFLLLCFFTGKNGMTKEQKEHEFAKLIAWGKKGGKFRAVIALTLIFLLLTFYYGIGMKTTKN